ncbi:protein of unknown function [Pseudorhizobium banfieldiae]|uniref:Uncharacterized protein n=1 Tax=Pseudorhizobium banfieldiae TaxID=1125847 RepID=L0NE51_9HYPH|nr:hypothetical protein [Pseudorhizobium banfieldiae]CAD6605842.1 hypothetical protein RNT25_01735 [arsenite-oxidising bacterium NT-25]CCF19081.1 protein of unknown function [Pseudorhizobium banfieldiae]
MTQQFTHAGIMPVKPMEPESTGITNQERMVIDMLVGAWNAFCELPMEHGDDQVEFRHGIHRLQEKILARPTRRSLKAEVRRVSIR